MELKNKIIVIVGGSQGFGKALAKSFIAQGSVVAIVSKNKEIAESAAKETGSVYFVADVRNEQSLRDTFDLVINKFGRIDIWVNSAGIFRAFPELELIDINSAHE